MQQPRKCVAVYYTLAQRCDNEDEPIDAVGPIIPAVASMEDSTGLKKAIKTTQYTVAYAAGIDP